MDVAGLIPTPDTIPVHWGWLLLMNLMLGGSLLALVGRARPRDPG